MTFLNVNRLLTHIDEIRIFIHINPKIDSLAINETKIDEYVADHEMTILGF